MKLKELRTAEIIQFFPVYSLFFSKKNREIHQPQPSDFGYFGFHMSKCRDVDVLGEDTTPFPMTLTSVKIIGSQSTSCQVGRPLLKNPPEFGDFFDVFSFKDDFMGHKHY